MLKTQQKLTVTPIHNVEIAHSNEPITLQCAINEMRIQACAHE